MLASDAQFKANPVGENVTLVSGPYEGDRGRPHWGGVFREAIGRYRAMGADGRCKDGWRDLGVHGKHSDAVQAVADWAPNNLTAAGIEADFETITQGGVTVQFLRRLGGRIDAVFVGERGERIQATWGEDGVCDLYRHAEDPAEIATGWRLRLVHRELELAA